MAKWIWACGANTVAGQAGWGGSVPDLTDANNDSTRLIVAVPSVSYPQTLDDGTFAGYITTAGAGGGCIGGDISPANAGNATPANADQLQAGYTITSSASTHFQRSAAPGSYDCALAMNHGGISAACGMAIFDGSVQQCSTDTGVGSSGFRIWQSGGTFAVNDRIVTSDLGVWRCSAQTGAAGSTEPNGPIGSANFTDGNVTWVRVARNALALINNTNTGTNTVVDQRGLVVNAIDFRRGTGVSVANPITLTVTGTYGNALAFMRLTGTGAGSQYIRTIGLRVQAATLVGSKIYDMVGNDQTADPKMYCHQPLNVPLHKISATAGASAKANWSLGNTLGAYFGLATGTDLPGMDLGSEVWLYQTTTIPDALGGTTVNLDIIQTSAGDIGSPYTTTHAVDLISSGGKPTGTGSILSLITTPAWLARKTVLDAVNGIFKGYTSGGFTTDQTANSPADLQTKLLALSTSGNPIHRIRLQNGTWTGNSNTAISKNFGSGMVLIEPDTGHDPEIQCAWQNLCIQGLHIRNLRWCLDRQVNGGVYYALQFTDPGSGNGFFNRVAITGMRFGMMYQTGYNETNITETYSGGQRAGNAMVLFQHGESFYGADNEFDGIGGGIWTFGVHLVERLRDKFYRYAEDLRSWKVAAAYYSTAGVFADNNCYLHFKDCLVGRNLDYVGLVNGAHVDIGQNRSLGGPAGAVVYAMYANGNRDGGATPWAVGNYGINPAVGSGGRVYQVAAITTGTCGATLPTGTGAGFVSGGVTWDYVADYPAAGACYVHCEGDAINCASKLSPAPSAQYTQDSNQGRNSPTHLSLLNCISALASQRGVTEGEGDYYVSFCTFLPPSETESSYSVQQQRIIRSSGKTFDFCNLYYGAPAGGGANHTFGSQTVDFAAAAVNPNRPSDKLRGTFSQQSGTNRWMYPTFPDDGSLTTAQFRDQLSKMLHHKTAGVGARLRETYSHAHQAAVSGVVNP